MKDTYDANIEDMRAEARKYEQETGRPVDFHEEYTETADGKRCRSFGYRIKPRSVREAVGLILKSGLKSQRDEDGVVRLHWPALEEEAQARPGADPQKHIEVTSWPIRSEDALVMISYLLFEKGWDGFAPRDLRQTARILEGHAYKFQEAVDISVVAEKSSLLAALLHHFTVQPGPWQGTAANLLKKLEGLCEIEEQNWVKAPDWPKNGQCLSTELTRIARWLKGEGITFTRERFRNERRICLRDGFAGEEVISGEEVDSDQSSVISDEDRDVDRVARPEVTTGVVSAANACDALPENGLGINESPCDASHSNESEDCKLQQPDAPCDASFRGSSSPSADEAVSGVEDDESEDPASDSDVEWAEVEAEIWPLGVGKGDELARHLARVLWESGFRPTRNYESEEDFFAEIAEFKRRHGFVDVRSLDRKK